MPIRDRDNRRLVRLGVIRLGHKEQRQRQDGSTYEYPVQDDHFLLHDAPEIEAYYHKNGIDQVRELDVLLPFPDIDRNFPTWYQVWAGGILVCQGDGKYVQHSTPFVTKITKSRKGVERTSVQNAPGDTLVSNGVACVPFNWNGSHFEEGEHVPCPGAKKDAYPHCKACKLSSVLKIMMADPELFRFGYYQISTGSGRNYDTIMGTLEAMPHSDLRGITYSLRIVEGVTSFVDDTGTRKKTIRWFLELEPDKKIVRRAYKQRTDRMLGAPEARPALVAGESRPPDEIIYADPPAPPPYAEDQVREPYEDEAPTGDELLNGDFHGTPPDADASEDQESKPPATMPVPNDLTHKNLPEKAVSLDGYSNVGAVKAAMQALYKDGWNRTTEWSPSEAWAQLQTHAAAETA